MKKTAFLSQSIFVLFFISFMFIGVNASTPPNLGSDFDFITLNNEVTITDYVGTSRDVIIPTSINGNPIVIISSNAFKNKDLTSVSLPNTVTTIGNEAFAGNNSLLIVNFNGNSVLTTVGDSVFMSTSLQTISTTSLSLGQTGFNLLVSQYQTFADNRAANINLDLSNVSHIGEAAFAFSDLRTLIIPSSMTAIGNGAFMYNNISDLDFSNRSSVFTNFGTNVFSGNSLTSISTTDLNLNDAVLKQLIETDGTFSENLVNTLVFPSGITSIGEYTFGDNELESILFPNTIIAIKAEAFFANYLDDVTLPSNLTVLGDEAFAENYLTDITLPASLMDIGNNVFSENFIESITFLGDLSLSLFQLDQYDFLDESETINGISTFYATYSKYINGHYFYSTFDPDTYTTTGDILAGTYTLRVADLLETTYNPNPSVDEPNLLLWQMNSGSTPSIPSTPTSPSTPTTSTPTNTTPSTTTSEPLPQTGVSSNTFLLLGFGLVLYLVSYRIKHN